MESLHPEEDLLAILSVILKRAEAKHQTQQHRWRQENQTLQEEWLTSTIKQVKSDLDQFIEGEIQPLHSDVEQLNQSLRLRKYEIEKEVNDLETSVSYFMHQWHQIDQAMQQLNQETYEALDHLIQKWSQEKSDGSFRPATPQGQHYDHNAEVVSLK